MHAAMNIRAADDEPGAGYRPGPAIEAAFHEAERYLELRSLQSQQALKLLAQVKLTRGRLALASSEEGAPETLAADVLRVGAAVLEHIAMRSRRPEALIRQLGEALAEERGARRTPGTCGDCGTTSMTTTTTRNCPNCGAPRIAGADEKGR